jgi:hypothetical protein
MRIVCLANSWRPGGRCVAGIDLETGRWVRPVPRGGGAILEGRTMIAGAFLKPLDVFEAELAPPRLKDRYQRENCEILNYSWRRVGRMTPAELMPFCSEDDPLLHSTEKTVVPAELDKLPPEQWKSLDLVHVRDARFVRDARNNDRWCVRFTAGRSATAYHLHVTDPHATQHLNRGGAIRPECLLCVSLAQPIAYPEYQLAELCYKIVATAIAVETG